MKGYFKLTAALAAFALLVVVMGLGTQNSVQAQEAAVRAPGAATGTITYVCSDAQTPGDGCDAGDATFDIAVTDATGDGALDATTGEPTTVYNPSRVVTIQNLDLPRDLASTTRPEDRNPKTLYLPAADTTFQVLVVRKSTGLTDANITRDDTSGAITSYAEVAGGNVIQVKGFHGHRLRITYSSGTGSIGTDATVTVDDVKPTLVSNSPATPLIVRGNTDITFSADITDGLSGYTGTNTASMGISTLTDSDDEGPLTTDATTAEDQNHETDRGGVRLVVAGNVVGLSHTNFTKIDGGWRVTKTLGSSALQNISTNIPWYFETRDRAGNTRRTSGSISGRSGGPIGGDAATPLQEATTLIDTRFSGNLGTNTFAGDRIRVTREDDLGNPVVSNSQPIAVGFSDGQFTFTNTAADPLFGRVPGRLDPDDATSHIITPYRCPFDPDDDGATVNGAIDPTNAVVDRTGATPSITTAAVPQNEAQLAECGAISGSSYQILSSNLITVDSLPPTLDAALTGKAYNPVTMGERTAKNSIMLTFGDLGARDSTAPGSGLDANTVTPGAFSVSGHTVESATLQSRGRVFLTLGDNLGSTETPTVSMASGVVKDRAGNAAEGSRVDKATDGLGPNLTLTKSADLSRSSVTITIDTDEQLSGPPTVWITEATDADGSAKIQPNGNAPTSSDVGTPVSSSDVRQTGAQSYSYTMRASGTNDGEYSVFVRATDTNSNASTKGDAASSSTANAFSFELDNRLNGGELPKVTVGEENTVTEDGSVLSAEAVDPLIVTVDFSNEGLARGKEYDRDGYRTVELTSAKLKVSFTDGTSETKTFNLTTDVSTPDKVKFTIPILNPKIGTYELTVQAKDSAGNVRTDSAGTTPQDLKATWKLISPRPVNIDLAPGWNLVSLPFQPANPAINSIIPSTHPADIVMTFDNATQVWLVSRRDAETGLFTGDINVMTASTAYFIRTENFSPIRMLRPPLATAAAAPPPPPAITVVKGWNLVPIVSNDVPTPDAIAADQYFGTLGGGSDAGWLKALTFDTLVRTWISVTPGDQVVLGEGGINPCTGAAVDPEDVVSGTEPCQIGQYTERSTRTDDTAAVEADPTANPAVEAADATGGPDGWVGVFDVDDTVVVGRPVEVGKGYWLYSTVDGVIIP